MKRILYFISAVWLCFACQSEVPTEEGAPIYLSASVEGSVESRVPYLSSPTPTPSEVLHAAVWATNIGAYIGSGLNGKDTDDKVDIHGSANFDDGQPKLLNDAVYPSSGVQVDFIGLHPQTGWTTVSDEGKIAEFTFDGSQDVMFASKQTGTYAETNDIDNVLPLHFQHLLTWLKIKIKAESSTTVAKSWGKVLEMKISSRNKVSIDLTKNYTFEDCVSFSGENNWVSLHKVGSDEVFPASEGFDLTSTSYEEEAYVLCEPVTATTDDAGEPTAEYTLYIKSERREVTLPIDLKRNESECFAGSTRAKHFTLNLNFMVGNIVTVQAEVTDWKWGASIDEDVEF